MNIRNDVMYIDVLPSKFKICRLLGAALAATLKYPFISNLLDSATGATGTLTRSTVKTFILDNGTVDSAAINAAAFVGSGVLIEPADTNVLTYSNGFSNAAWTKSACTITSGQTDPNGGTTGYKMTVTAGGAAVVASSAYTYSGSVRHSLLIVKKGTCNYLNVRLFNNPVTMGVKVCLNLTTMAVSAYAADPGSTYISTTFKSLANGFYLVDINYTVSGTGGFTYIYASNDPTAGAVSSTVGETVYLYFAGAQQLPSSPIPTDGTALTRTVDALTVPTTSFKTSDFGYYLEFTPKVITASAAAILENYSDSSNYLTVFCTNIEFSIDVRIAGVAVTVAVAVSPAAGTKYKILVRQIGTTVHLNINGTESSVTISGSAIINAANLKIGNAAGLAAPNGVFANFKHINTSDVTLVQAEAL